MAESKRDYYEVLGVSKDADEATLKKAYRQVAKKYHPDMNPGDAEAEKKFKEASEAYAVLSDPEKRRQYDQFGHAAFDGSAGAGGGYGGFDFNGADFGDIFGDIFENMFGGGKKSSFHQGASGFNGFHRYSGGFGADAASEKGSDAQAEINISFDDAAFGVDRVITLSGTDGSRQNLQIHIPAGIGDGQSIRLKGKGNPGMGSGEAGDLLLKVHVGTRPGYERKGMDVYTSTEVPFMTAVLGGEIIVPTLYGNVSCKIKEGTRCGSKIRLAGRGIVSMKDPKIKGDQYVTIQIAVPQNLTEDAKRKLKEFTDACKTSSRHAA